MVAHSPSDAAPAEPRLTPMMAQYIEIKAANPDCLLFYRMGDFYELFFSDAEEASRALGIVLTKRGKHLGEDIPMCGVPIERAPDYLQRLIALGHRVAVCEQIEDPAEARKRGGKSVVRRAVTRLVTPGTITEEALLEPGRSALLVALARTPSSDGGFAYGLAAVDLSTGRFTLAETGENALGADIARLEPREILVPDAILDEPALKPLWRDQPGLTPLAREGLDPVSAEQRLAGFYGVRSLAGFGAFSRAELVAGAAVLAYVERTQIGARPALSPPSREPRDGRMQIDPATRVNLELTRTLAGERAGSLLATIDRTVTPAGARLLAERLAGPLIDPAAIARRLDAVERLAQDADLRQTLRRLLKAAPDFARALSRLALERGGPRDLAALRDGLGQALAIGALLKTSEDLPEELRDAAAMLLALDPVLSEALAAALAAELPLNKRDGGFVRTGHDPALDEARALRDESRQVIAALQARYAQATGARNLRVKHNHFLGYFIETPQAVGETLLQPPHNGVFIHRQTMQGAMRFSTAELSELESRIASAGERALALELAIFDALAARALAQAGPIRDGADALAVIDVAAGLAECAEEGGWTRPLVDETLAFTLEGARHPVVEAALKREGQPFIANDAELSPPEPGQGARIALITGPNMAGKSTYLRQNALIAALAQMGSFVPARRAYIGAVDRLFSRVGAADDLARGRSTFMVEMIETAAILNQAGPRSLVILDEIGRGTATYDGLSIAWAAIEHLHGENRCRTLFATHFHELTALAKRLPRLITATMRVAEWKGDVVFLHEVAPGVADRSYGIQVAKLAGLPASVVARARVILDELEALDRKAPVEALVDDLPLFAARPAPTPAGPDHLREALAGIAPDELSPREALEQLYRLKTLAKS